MADEGRISLQSSFYLNWDDASLRTKLDGLEGRLWWTIQYGPIGARRGVFVWLEDRIGVEIWRNSGQPMFGAGTGQNVHFEAEPGELYGMEISFPANWPADGLNAGQDAVQIGLVHRAVREQILKQLGAISAYDYAVVQILAAVADKREVLDLSGQGLDELPAEIGMLTELLALDVSKNRLSRLPAEIGRLTKLEELEASDNQFIELPTEIGELVELRKLVLDRNRLVSLPAEIGRLTRLHSLHIQDNALSTLPPEIGELVEVRQLWLQNSQLTALPVELCQMTKLNDWVPDGKHLPPRFAWALQLEGNPLNFPPPDVIRKGSKAVREFLAAYRASRDCAYIVWVVENSSKVYQDQNERRSVFGYYKDCAAAVAASEKVIDDYLATLPHGTAEELYQAYALRGQEARIHGKMDTHTFSAREYAKRRCEELAGEWT